MSFPKTICPSCGVRIQSRKLVCGRTGCKPVIKVGRTGYTLEEVLNKIYLVQPVFRKNGLVRAQLSFPNILAGRRVRLVLVE